MWIAEGILVLPFADQQQLAKEVLKITLPWSKGKSADACLFVIQNRKGRLKDS